MSDILEIDGAVGEGGGQILRSSLTMSLITGKPFRMKNIRAKRKNPGLAPQHLSAIQSAAMISASEVEGAHVGSQDLTFSPGTVSAGNYCFQVNTAGAMPLVFQTVALPLALTQKKSRCDFRGGTHVPWAPPFEYLAHVWGNVVNGCGFQMDFFIHQAGYYPKGGGHFHVEISPFGPVHPVRFTERKPLEEMEAICVLSGLPEHIAQREFEVLERELGKRKIPAHFHRSIKSYPSPGPGNMLLFKARFGKAHAGFSVIGERGKPAEKVGREVAQEFMAYLESEAPVERHLADQLLLPLCLAQGVSTYRVSEISQHLLTNAHIIGFFAGVKIEVSGEEGKSGTVTVDPAGFKPREM